MGFLKFSLITSRGHPVITANNQLEDEPDAAGNRHYTNNIREDFAKRSNKTPQRKSQVICGQKGVYNLPATPEAKLWNGWKSHGLKPAVECWWVAMKPNEGSYAANAMKWGVSGLNIDGGRIEVSDKDIKDVFKKEGRFLILK